MRTRVTVLLAATLLATLAACTSDSEPGEADGTPSAGARKPSGTPTPAETAAADITALETAVHEYTAAYFANDPDTAFGMLTARCQKQTTLAGMAALTERAEQTERAIGDDEPKEVKRFEVDELTGDSARVSYGVGEPKFDQKQEPWAREAGVWRYDSC